MMILHIVSASPYSSDALQRCAALFGAEDGILLIEDGVLALSDPDRCLAPFNGKRIYILQPDAEARGMSADQRPSFAAVDYDGFVSLTTQFTKTVSWF